MSKLQEASNTFRRVVVIGNAGAGKTTLSRKLSQLHQLPVIHVDAIQFLPGPKRSLDIRPYRDSIQILKEVHDQKEWIIDGYGPLDILIERLGLADRIVLIDLPLWRHYWWCTKRQIKNLWSPRSELPEGCNELSLSHTLKLYKTLWRVHRQMRPELLRILARPEHAPKLIVIRSPRQWRGIYRQGLE